LARVLDAWDRFDHPRALELLDEHTPPGADRLRPALVRLASTDRGTREPLVLIDLWLNALRCAARGRHDDAILRAYRLVEWCAQWVLHAERDITTDKVSREQIGDKLFKCLDRRHGRSILKVGLEQALDIVRVCLPDHSLTRLLGRKSEAREALTLLVDPKLGWKERRNRSLCAHGFTPLGADDWQIVAIWCETYLLPWLTDELAARNLTHAQLPTSLRSP
jgi:hypothetical protein